MKLVNGVRRWSVLILVSALVVTVPLTVAEARGHGGGGGGHWGIGGGAGRGGFGHGGGFSHGGFGHGFRGHGFSHGGFRGSVVIGLGGWCGGILGGMEGTGRTVGERPDTTATLGTPMVGTIRRTPTLPRFHRLGTTTGLRPFRRLLSLRQ